MGQGLGGGEGRSAAELDTVRAARDRFGMSRSRVHLAVHLPAVLAVSGLVACTSPVKPLIPVPQRVGDGFLTIQTEKSGYTWAEVSLRGAGIRATLVNHTDRSFYARLGDGFNAALEQERLHIAEGSHAFVEQWVSPSSWRILERAVLIEGVGTIVLRPHGTYTLHGHVLGPENAGVFQLRVQYFDHMDVPPDAAAHQDFSDTFVIK